MICLVQRPTQKSCRQQPMIKKTTPIIRASVQLEAALHVLNRLRNCRVMNGPMIYTTTALMRNIQIQCRVKMMHSGTTANINPLIQGMTDNSGLL